MTTRRPDIALGGPVAASGSLEDLLAGRDEHCDALAVTVGKPLGEVAEPAPPPVPDGVAVLAAAAYGVDLRAVCLAEKVTGRAGEVVRVPVQAPQGLPARLLLVGTGDGGPADLRRAGAALARAARGRGTVVTSLAGAGTGVREAVEGLLLGGYRLPPTGTSTRPDGAPAARVVLLGDQPPADVAAGERHAEATLLARELTGTPSSTKTPVWVADRAVELAADTPDGVLTVDVRDEHRLAADGFGGLLAVGGGSVSPPRLVRLDLTPPGTAGRRPVVLIGKGVTYDTGGLSIKPREAMVPMKTDMAGAGVVLAVLAALAGALGGSGPLPSRPVVGLLPLAENAVGASSYRPGDVVRHHGGRTVEVVNTDAEGRMLLADALAYADAELDPETVVDVATLTGAASLGLGRRHAALYSTDDGLAAELEGAAGASGERVWRMPLVEDYRPALDSAVADLRHVPVAGPPLGAVGGGSITAALFLREFAAGRRWAHLDIAGPARADKDEHEVVRGATGFGARLLLRWLEAPR